MIEIIDIVLNEVFSCKHTNAAVKFKSETRLFDFVDNAYKISLYQIWLKMQTLPALRQKFVTCVMLVGKRQIV